MEEANASFLRYRGPPILPSSEVVYIVHPYLTTQLYQKGLAPQDLDQRKYDRICRAFSGDDGNGPDYPNCWARSTAWAHGEFLKIIEKQHDAVSDSIGNAVSLIGADKHRNGEFQERFFA
ncbi:MAG: hypothetical protein Q9192_006939 [Flavoplaca navasiana]